MKISILPDKERIAPPPLPVSHAAFGRIIGLLFAPSNEAARTQREHISGQHKTKPS